METLSVAPARRRTRSALNVLVRIRSRLERGETKPVLALLSEETTLPEKLRGLEEQTLRLLDAGAVEALAERWPAGPARRIARLLGAGAAFRHRLRKVERLGHHALLEVFDRAITRAEMCGATAL